MEVGGLAVGLQELCVNCCDHWNSFIIQSHAPITRTFTMIVRHRSEGRGSVLIGIFTFSEIMLTKTFLTIMKLTIIFLTFTKK